MKTLLLPVLLLLVVSCNQHNGSNDSGEPIGSAEAKEEFQKMQADFKTWWIYHHDNINLSAEFSALNDKGETIDKETFLQSLITGNFIPVNRETADSIDEYQLIKIAATADKSISEVISDISATVYRYYKMEGEDFPSFSFTDLEGKSYDKESLLGKTIVLKCWFIGCKPCIEEFPELNTLVDDYGDRDDIVFVSLALDGDKALKKFLSRKEFKYKTIPDQKAFIQEELEVLEYPTHFIVSKTGKIEKVLNKSTELIAYLKEGGLLKKQENNALTPPPPAATVR